MTPRHRLLLAVLLAALLPSLGWAQAYPSKPIRLVVPFGTGGSNDIIARLLAAKLGEALAQSVVVENRPGAGGTIGTDSVVKADPDGYTLMIGATSTIAVNVGLYPKRNFDPATNLTPITQIAAGPFLMAVPASLPARNVKEFIELAKAKPGELNFGSSGKGSSLHLTAEMFKSMAKVDLVHIPYKSGGAAIADLATARVQLVYSDLPALLPFVKNNQVRPIAVTTPTRWHLLPDLPTVAESGVPGYDATSWYGILGPAGLPRDIVSRLGSEIAKIVHSAEIKQRFNGMGVEPVTSTPEEFSRYIREQVTKWSGVIKSSGAQLE
jgi:tripartite-type tricarboxylate transporter receptor subunit TctC